MFQEHIENTSALVHFHHSFHYIELSIGIFFFIGPIVTSFVLTLEIITILFIFFFYLALISLINHRFLCCDYNLWRFVHLGFLWRQWILEFILLIDYLSYWLLFAPLKLLSFGVIFKSLILRIRLEIAHIDRLGWIRVEINRGIHSISERIFTLQVN